MDLAKRVIVRPQRVSITVLKRNYLLDTYKFNELRKLLHLHVLLDALIYFIYNKLTFYSS